MSPPTGRRGRQGSAAGPGRGRSQAGSGQQAGVASRDRAVPVAEGVQPARVLRHPGRVLIRSQIIEAVWDFAYDGGFNVVNQYVNHLRRTIDTPFGGRDLETVRGMAQWHLAPGSFSWKPPRPPWPPASRMAVPERPGQTRSNRWRRCGVEPGPFGPYLTSSPTSRGPCTTPARRQGGVLPAARTQADLPPGPTARPSQGPTRAVWVFRQWH